MLFMCLFFKLIGRCDLIGMKGQVPVQVAVVLSSVVFWRATQGCTLSHNALRCGNEDRARHGACMHGGPDQLSCRRQCLQTCLVHQLVWDGYTIFERWNPINSTVDILLLSL